MSVANNPSTSAALQSIYNDGASTSAAAFNNDTTAAAAATDNSNVLNIDYQSPQQALSDALNFTNAFDTDPMLATAATTAAIAGGSNKLNNTMRNMLKKFNDSKYIYPGVALLTIVILVILLVFQSTVSMMVKFIAILILILFAFYSVYQCKKN